MAAASAVVLLLAGYGPAEAPDRVSPLASPAAPGSSGPHLAVAPGGRVVMSWLEPAGDGFGAVWLSTAVTRATTTARAAPARGRARITA
jgi:hypothetical protein